MCASPHHVPVSVAGAYIHVFHCAAALVDAPDEFPSEYACVCEGISLTSSV